MKNEGIKTQRRPEDYFAWIAIALEGEADPAWRNRLELMQKGLAGDQAAMDAVLLSVADLRAETATGEAELTLGQQFSDPVELARRTLLKAVYGDVEAIQELGRRRMTEIERDMAGPNPTPLERLSAQRIAFCWLQLFHYETLYARRMNKEPQDSLGIQKEEFYQKRVARAQRNYELAIKTMAQVRRLQLPTMQVNIADRQINVGSGQVKVGEAQVNILAEPEGEGEE